MQTRMFRRRVWNLWRIRLFATAILLLAGQTLSHASVTTTTPALVGSSSSTHVCNVVNYTQNIGEAITVRLISSSGSLVTSQAFTLSTITAFQVTATGGGTRYCE